MKKVLLIIGCSLFLTQGCVAMEAESEFLQELRARFAQPQDVNSKDGYEPGQPFLHEAVEQRDTGAITFLIDQQHANPNVQNVIGDYPIHYAIRKRHQRMVALLLEKHADANSEGAEGKTPLHIAALYRNQQIVAALLAHGANPNIRDNRGDLPLHVSVMGHNPVAELVRLLIENNADANVKNKDNNTPLHIATRNEQQPIMQVLLAGKANPDIQDAQGDTPLHIAARARQQPLVEVLIAHRANITLRDNGGNTPLHVALTGNNAILEIVKALISKDSIESTNSDGNTPLHVAVLEPSIGIDIIELLLKEGANPVARNARKEFPRDIAVNEQVKYMVNYRVKICLFYLKDYTWRAFATAKGFTERNIDAIWRLAQKGFIFVLNYRQGKAKISDLKDAGHKFINKEIKEEDTKNLTHLVFDEMIAAGQQGTAASDAPQAAPQAAPAGAVVPADDGICTIL